MNLKTQETAAEARDQATKAITEASKTVRDARRQARRQVFRARVAAAKARAGTRAKASRTSTRAVGAAGAVGLAAGYFLDPESGKRRRDRTRERVAALIRRDTNGAGASEALQSPDSVPADPISR